MSSICNIFSHWLRPCSAIDRIRAQATSDQVAHGSLSLVNSLHPGKFEWNFGYVIFKHVLVIDGWNFCCEIALIWMSLDFTDDQSTLVQVMAWCRQAPSHYLNQCWPRSLLPYGITRLQWVNSISLSAPWAISYLDDASARDSGTHPWDPSGIQDWDFIRVHKGEL